MKRCIGLLALVVLPVLVACAGARPTPAPPVAALPVWPSPTTAAGHTPTLASASITASPAPTQVSPTAPPDTWVADLQTDPRSAALDAVRTGDGAYLLVGATHYTHREGRAEDVHLMKVDAGAEILWDETYGGDAYDRGKAIIATGDGAWLVLAETESEGAGGRDVLLIKVDSDGQMIWSSTVGGPADEKAYGTQQTADGGFVIAGVTASYGDGSDDVYLVKTDARGRQQWFRAFGSDLIDEGYVVHQTADGGYLVLAQVMRPAAEYMAQDPDRYLIRTDQLGNEVWSRIWQEPGVQGPTMLLPARDGNWILAGLVSTAAEHGATDPWFVEVDDRGEAIWEKTIGDPACFDYASGIAGTADGGYVLTGMAVCGSRSSVLLIRTDVEGDLLWRGNLMEGEAPRIGLKVFEAPDGGLVVMGQVDGRGLGFETFLLKTDSRGHLEP